MTTVDRRHFLGAVAAAGMAAACSPAAGDSPGSSAGGPSGWEQEWQDVLAAAKREGRVSVMTRAGEGYRRWVETFQEAYPDIALEHSSVPSVTVLAPRMREERKAGVYSFDAVILAPGRTSHTELVPEGIFDPIKPAIILPDALEDKNWIGGFDFGLVDLEKKYIFGYGWEKSLNIWRNSDLVKDGEINSIKDLLDPRFKGRMTFTAYSTGNTYSIAVGIMRNYPPAEADEIMRKLFVEQEPVWGRDTRQITESLVRGRHAVAIGPSKQILLQFHEAGLGNNVKPLEIPEQRSVSLEAIYLYNRAPRPNAGKVFINWALSKAGQEAWVKHSGISSRRTDVAPGDPIDYPGTDVNEIKRTYFITSLGENQDLPVEAVNKLQKLVS